MMAELRSLSRFDHGAGRSTVECPEGCEWLRLVVGPAGGNEQESFDVCACTPAWLARRVAEHGPQPGLHHLIVEQLHEKAIGRFLDLWTRRQQAHDWPTLASRLSRLARRVSLTVGPGGGDMTAAVRSVSVIDGEDLGSGAAWLRLMVGPSEGPGEESFDVHVCTPTWLGEQVAVHGPLIGRHHLVVARMDLDSAAGFLRRIIENERADSWAGLTARFQDIGSWEFEDYTPLRDWTND